ncbi:hypothetical protein [Streptomyces oceani]|uniref:hypothetical protein n=1 Tax=Streptomyces oceani TaxID=1075402 RepID=UPI000A4CCC1E|nr:hypothetical protein [Streptomyces oceani]
MTTDLSDLDAAATAWKKMGRDFGDLRDDYQKYVRSIAKGNSWEGVAAEVFLESSTKTTAHEFLGAENQAIAIGNLLLDAYKQLKKMKKAVEDVRDDAIAAGMHVNSSGRCSYDVDKNTPEQNRVAAQHPDHAEALERKWDERIRDAVQKVSDADYEIKAALHNITKDQDGKGEADGFNSKASGDVSVNSAERAVELARKGDEMNETKLNQFNTLLKQNTNDKVFAETFAKRMGADGTLGFWYGLQPNSSVNSEKRQTLLNRIQRNLGKTLGTATRSDSPAMERWENEMISQGPKRLDGYYSPRGYQVMTDLMRSGDYDNQFLRKYGDSLVQFEKEQRDKGYGPEDVWLSHSGDDAYSTSQIENPWNNDPVTGLMEGLGHNPGASTKFFLDEENYNYLVNTGQEGARDWPTAALSSGEGTGHNSLGHALESAVTGHSYGGGPADSEQWSGQRDRGEVQAELMRRVMETYGGPDSPREQQPGMGDSLGRMGAAYIDDINYGIHGFGGKDQEKMDYDKILGSDGGDLLKGKNGEILLDSPTVVSFMGELGVDEEAYDVMSKAQAVYTAERISEHSETEDAYGAAKLGAYGHGMLDEARVQAIGDEYDDDVQRYKAKTEEANKWLEGVSSTAVYTATGGLSAVTMGGSAFLMPSIAGGAGSAITAMLNEQIGGGENPQQKIDGDDIAHLQLKFNNNALENSTNSIYGYMDREGIEGYERGDIASAVENFYYRGKMLVDDANEPEED